MSDDFPIPVAVLAVAAAVGAIFIGIAIALCCYFCIPHGSRCRRLFPKQRHRTVPSTFQPYGDDCCIRCCFGVPLEGITASERRRGYINVDPYVIPIDADVPVPVASTRPIAWQRSWCDDFCRSRSRCGDSCRSCPPCDDCCRSRCGDSCRSCPPCDDCCRSRCDDSCRSCSDCCSQCDDTCCKCSRCDDECCTCCTPIQHVATAPAQAVVRQPAAIAYSQAAVQPVTAAPAQGSLFFTKHLTNKVLTSYPTLVALECELNRPNVGVAWSRNGFPVDQRRTAVDASERVHRLLIHRCDPADVGRYECSVVPQPGMTGQVPTTWADVNIKMPPKLFIDKYVNKIVETKVGQDVYFHLPFDGHPRPAITMTYNGDRPLPDPARMPVEGVPGDKKSIFTICSPVRSDSGTYVVSAENESGRAVGQLVLAVKDRPTVPRDFYAAQTQPTSCKINWIKPADDGGSPLEAYAVEGKKPSEKQWRSVGRYPPDINQADIASLDPDNQYDFRVAAFNKYGVSDWNTLRVATTKPRRLSEPAGLPAKPDPPQVSEIFKDKCRLDWRPPLSDGGSPITGYQLEQSEAGTKKWQPLPRPSTLNTPVNNLKDNKKYQFRVAAENGIGRGPFSDPSPAVLAKNPWNPPGKPDRPDVSDISAAHCQVNWKPPVSDGGAPISRYAIQGTEAGTNNWKPVSELSPKHPLALPVDNLDPNNKYQFRVAAENVAGRGPFSDPSKAISPVDPATVPDRPGRPRVTDVTDKTADINWLPPKWDGGAPITDYLVEVAPSSKPTKPAKSNTGGPRLDHTLRNLKPKETYNVQVRAVNKVGKSDPSEPSEVALRVPEKAVAKPPVEKPRQKRVEKPVKAVAKPPLKRVPPPAAPKPAPLPVQHPPKRVQPSPEPSPRMVEQVDAGICNCGPSPTKRPSAVPPQAAPPEKIPRARPPADRTPEPRQPKVPRERTPVDRKPKAKPPREPRPPRERPPAIRTPRQPRPLRERPPVIRTPRQPREPRVHRTPAPKPVREPRQPRAPREPPVARTPAKRLYSPPRQPEPRPPRRPEPKPEPRPKRVKFVREPPPPKKEHYHDLNDRPSFNTYFGMAMNKLLHHDIQRKITQF